MYKFCRWRVSRTNQRGIKPGTAGEEANALTRRLGKASIAQETVVKEDENCGGQTKILEFGICLLHNKRDLFTGL